MVSCSEVGKGGDGGEGEEQGKLGNWKNRDRTKRCSKVLVLRTRKEYTLHSTEKTATLDPTSLVVKQ